MIQKFIYSFPIQLLINNFKRNHLLLLCWVFLFAVVTENFGKVLGIPYLFLDPEYNNQVNFWSFFIMGIAMAGFTMAFHITCYIIDGHRFNFLGTLSRPFAKFTINNAIIPTAFMIVYTISIVRFQIDNEYNTVAGLIEKIAGLLLGFACMFTLLFTYFRLTNKDIFKIVAFNVDKKLKKAKIARQKIMTELISARKTKMRVDNYLDLSLKTRKVTTNQYYYNKEAILKVFDQNHLNSVIIEALIFGVIIFLGIFRETAAFQLPAGASGVFFFTMFLMFAGAIIYWFRAWATSVVILLLIFFNILIKNGVITSTYQAYGLNYHTEKAEYSLDQLQHINRDELYIKDKNATLEILNNWRNKFPAKVHPKMIFICTSGGGQRSALWTMNALQMADSLTNGRLMKQTMLITGASGGLMGAGYFRELYRRKQSGENINIYDAAYLKDISDDMLNPIIFTLLVNDLFVRYQKFDYEGFTYVKDRGYAFEQQLSKNTHHFLDKRLMDYKEPERLSQIPMMIMAPTIINDGRKLFISPQHVSYMNRSNVVNNHFLDQKIKGLDFTRFFAKQNAGDLRFLSALRMSATFPYITPNVTLPSNPPMEIMDAGISDNFGVSDAISFLAVFQDWISKNTSGVILLSIRDSEKEPPIEKNLQPGLFQKFSMPIRSLYNNWSDIQDIKNDNQIDLAVTWFKGELNHIELEYITGKIVEESPGKPEKMEQLQKQKEIERASLSWRLTSREKDYIKNSIYLESNQLALKKLQGLLQEERLIRLSGSLE